MSLFTGYILELTNISCIYSKYTPPVTCPFPWQWGISMEYIPAKRDIRLVISHREGQRLSEAKGVLRAKPETLPRLCESTRLPQGISCININCHTSLLPGMYPIYTLYYRLLLFVHSPLGCDFCMITCVCPHVPNAYI